VALSQVKKQAAQSSQALVDLTAEVEALERERVEAKVSQSRLLETLVKRIKVRTLAGPLKIDHYPFARRSCRAAFCTIKGADSVRSSSNLQPTISAEQPGVRRDSPLP
jgi:anti-sigma28 factor (negative regulator of flagellin synthesis)